jgi:hypothetical protein
MNYKIEAINLDDIIQYDTEKYNSNNHWTNNIIPDNYKEVLSKSNTEKWISLFKPEYKKITIDNPTYINWIYEASKISSLTGKFSLIYTDELEQMIDETKEEYKNIFDGTGYFIKVNNVSLKYGMHGVGPYYDLKSIIESIVSSILGHTPIKDNTGKLDIYIIPWSDIDTKNEFRVFVYKNKITAISQQHLYSKFHLNNQNEIVEKIDLIVKYHFEHIINKITWTTNYTYDFAIIDSMLPYFIEMNSFGKEYAAGSALFHWILDEKILYNMDNTNTIYFRYTI